MSLAITLHVLATVIWVGGMFFAHVVLRPVALSQLEPPLRLRVWAGVFSRFFVWVWMAVILLPITGYWIIFTVLGGMHRAGMYIHVMSGIGLVMISLYLWLYFVPYRAFRRAVSAENWPEGAKRLAQMRRIVGTNLVLGLVTAAVAGGGKYLGW